MIDEATRDFEVRALRSELDDIRAELDMLRINGLNDAFSGSGNQTFSGSTMRLNARGIQIRAPSTPAIGLPGFKALFWLNNFAVEPGFASNRSYADGHANATESVASLSAVNASSAVDGTGGYAAAVFATALATGERYVLVRPELLLDPQTVDPSILGNGALWYRSDLSKFRAQVAGVTGNLGVEIQSAAAPAIGGGSTIISSVSCARVAPAGAVTGVILAVGTTAGQVCTVVNESVAANTVTFAALGSNVADGASSVIAGLNARTFVWDSVTALWYPVK